MIKPALIAITGFVLFVWIWLELMSLHEATHSAALSLSEPVRF